MINVITMILKNTILMLRQIHVLGAEAGMLDSAIKNIEKVIKTIEDLEKEAAQDADCGEQRKDV